MSDDGATHRIVTRGLMGVPRSWTLTRGEQGEPTHLDVTQIPDLCFTLPEGLEVLPAETAPEPLKIEDVSVH